MFLQIITKIVSKKNSETYCGKITVISPTGDVIFFDVPAHANAISTGDRFLKKSFLSEEGESSDEYGIAMMDFEGVKLYSGRAGQDGRIRKAHPQGIRVGEHEFATIFDLSQKNGESGTLLIVEKPWFMLSKEKTSRDEFAEVPFVKKNETHKAHIFGGLSNNAIRQPST